MYTKEDAMREDLCSKCNNQIMAKLSLATGICSDCREKMYPEYLPDSQWVKYWKFYMEKN